MADLVEDWKDLENYAGYKQGFYQILEDGEATEIRVTVGRLGFRKEFKNKEGTLLNQILTFCRARKYIKINGSVRDEFFFK